MNLLPTSSVLSYCQSFDLSNFADLPTPVSQLLHDVTASINDLSLDDEDIALLNSDIENYLIDVENAYTGHIIDSSYVNSSLYSQDIDKLVNSYSPLVPSDVLFVFALNKLVASLESDSIDHLWVAFGEASQAFALAKISTAVSATILCHEEFLGQISDDVLDEFKKLKSDFSAGGNKAVESMSLKQKPFYDRARAISEYIWAMHSYISPNKMAELIRDHFDKVNSVLLGTDVIPKIAKLSTFLAGIKPSNAPKRLNIGKEDHNKFLKNEIYIKKQIIEFDKP